MDRTARCQPISVLIARDFSPRFGLLKHGLANLVAGDDSASDAQFDDMLGSSGPASHPAAMRKEQRTPRAHFEDNISQRKREILEVAAQLFAKHGYRGTSMRDIGEQTGVLGGSLYHHIKSKDALFVELSEAALLAASDRIAAAVGAHAEPWPRFEAACQTLLEIQLDPDSLTLPLMNDFHDVPDHVRRAVIASRDTFETQFRDIVSDLPLPDDIDRSIYRNLLLSLLNGTSEWYRPGRLSPAEIACQIALIFKH